LARKRSKQLSYTRANLKVNLRFSFNATFGKPEFQHMELWLLPFP
jgi:hypothetical protein